MPKLIVTEKQSVSKSVAEALGKFIRRDGYFEAGEYLISWCVGHLIEDAPADAYDPRYAKWNREDLPIIPEDWQYRIIPDTKERYDALAALMNSGRVSEIWNFCDAGREGELIFRLVYNQCGCRKPVKRLWVSSMEASAIRKGIAEARDGAEYDSLYHAALCRQRADWLVGINATRLFSLLHPIGTIRVGRVMTPTLALIAEREAAIRAFKEEAFYTTELNLGGFRAVSERFASKEDAERLRMACQGAAAVVKSAKRQEKRESPPKLYDLTSLQRDANRLFGYTAKQSLDFLQSLYEKGLATYPRTDSRYLTDDMAAGLPELCAKAAAFLPFATDSAAPVHAEQVIDNAKVSDHHAVIPTAEIANVDTDGLIEGERNILSMVAVRLLCAVGEPMRYTETAATLECGGADFSAKGKTVTDTGWKSVEKAFTDTLKNKEDDSEPSQTLPELAEGQTIENADAIVKEGATKPPSRYTDATLLSAMERAGAEDFAKIEGLERSGLGTPATRADIIEKLVNAGFVARERKRLVPTEKGMAINALLPERLKSASMTVEWEEKLKEVERGTLEPEAFLSEIQSAIRALVRSYDGVKCDKRRPSNRPPLGVCPRCGRPVREGKYSFYCDGYYGADKCLFSLRKEDKFFTGKGKRLTKDVAEKLLKKGRVHMTKLRSEKKGTEYDADIVMEDTGGKYVNFRLEFPEKRSGKKA